MLLGIEAKMNDKSLFLYLMEWFNAIHDDLKERIISPAEENCTTFQVHKDFFTFLTIEEKR